MPDHAHTGRSTRILGDIEKAANALTSSHTPTLDTSGSSTDIPGAFSSSAVSGETYILLSHVIGFGSGKIKKTMKNIALIAVIKIM